MVHSPPAIMGAALPPARPRSQRSAHQWAGASHARKQPVTRCGWFPPPSSHSPRLALQMHATRLSGKTRPRVAHTPAPSLLHRGPNRLETPRHNLWHTTWAGTEATTGDGAYSAARSSAAADLPVITCHTLRMKLQLPDRGIYRQMKRTEKRLPATNTAPGAWSHRNEDHPWRRVVNAWRKKPLVTTTSRRLARRPPNPPVPTASAEGRAPRHATGTARRWHVNTPSPGTVCRRPPRARVLDNDGGPTHTDEPAASSPG